jgi:tricorn protease-like protein
MRIPLTQGTYAQIDESDYALIAPYTWSASARSGAVAWHDGKMIKMHRLIAALQEATERAAAQIAREA